jgi:uncharacterized protein YbaA (DUF1428 family)
MSYVDGFVVAVPAANKEAYRRHAAEAAPLFREFGVIRMAECWGDDVPGGKLTDFRRSVKGEDGEIVVFSWLEYRSKAVRDAANERFRSDPRLREMGAHMPFDASRMIYGGFASILDEGAGGEMAYVDGFLVAVPTAKKGAYRDMAAKAAPIFLKHGATRIVENWGDDVPDGKVTDFRRAVQAAADETVVFSWIEWPSRQARNEGSAKVMADPLMQMDGQDMPFDGKRMIYGGFASLLDA